MTANPSRLPYALAIVAGTILWTLTAAIGGRAEPWDAAVYWSVSYPLAIVLAGVFAYLFPERAWRWALALMLTQALVMVLGGSGLGLLPIGVVVLAVLSLPAVAVASRVAKSSPHRVRD